jgi:hypothetical protein
MTVCEQIFRGFKYELPSTSINRFSVTADVVSDPDSALRELLREHACNGTKVAHEEVEAFKKEFSAAHSLNLHFTNQAIDLLHSIAQSENRSIGDVCKARFRDFQFGLKLISQNSGKREFTIDGNAVEEPEKVLSEWVVLSYRRSVDRPL